VGRFLAFFSGLCAKRSGRFPFPLPWGSIGWERESFRPRPPPGSGCPSLNLKGLGRGMTRMIGHHDLHAQVAGLHHRLVGKIAPPPGALIADRRASLDLASRRVGDAHGHRMHLEIVLGMCRYPRRIENQAGWRQVSRIILPRAG